jgi:thiol:disulfide interchange protein DsbD
MYARLNPVRLLILAALTLVSFAAHAQLQTLGDGGPGPVKGLHITAELVSLAPNIAPGGTQQVGLVLTMEEHWHVYWVNSGDAGYPPTVTWKLPKGITAGTMQFGIPSRLPNGPLMDYGYEDTAAYPFVISAAPNLKPGPVRLDAIVSWLVCREQCVPEKAHLGIDLNVTAGAKEGPLVGALGTTIKNLPKPLPPDMKFSVIGGKTDFFVTLITGKAQDQAEFYPFDQDIIQNAAEQEVDNLPDGIRLRIARSQETKELPKTLHGLIKLGDTEAYDVTAPVVPGEVAASAPAAAPSSASPAPAADASGKVTTIGAIALAFFGGLILNLMPCVFPVLFLKGLALVQSSTEERSELRKHGLVYTLGILVSFWAIVAVLLIVRAGGSQAGWGFQLQSPVFLTLLASGIFFFALSLAGMFDIGLSLTNLGDGLAQKQGYTGSFFTGVLATVVATPCTAPLMGAAIGFALAQPAPITFAVFTALALGLATPYLALSFQPAWTRIMPRPGAWMEIFKQVTAAIFFATVIWLTYVYGALFTGPAAGTNAIYRVALLMTCFLALTVAAWVLGKWPARWPSTIAAVLIAAAALAIPLYQPKDTTLVWQPYTPQTLQAARSTGNPVFIDFTAAWCLSCQVNERLVLKSAEVQHDFASKKFTLLRADWTQYDPEITRQLQSINRSGVPTYVIYPGGASSSADVLPELLTKSIVLDAIQKDAK